MTLNPLNAFLSQLTRSWHLTQSEIPATLPYLFSGNNPWGNILVIQDDPHASFHIKHCQKLLKTIPNCVIIQFNTHFIHVYAQSLMDPEPIIAMDIEWENNANFWKLGKCESYLAFCFELNAEFGKTRLEKKFVLAFKQQREKLALAWQHIPEELYETREQLALTTLLRLLFIAFIEERGILDSRPHFIHEEALKCVVEKYSIFKHFLVPLFFETLNRPYTHRTARAKAFGRIPFLNGGLFTPTPVETQFADLDVPNAVILEIIETIFEAYTFNTMPIQDKFELRLDPMMLGHVFESLMNKSQRSSTGSYYTPMPLARQLVSEAFQIYFQNQFHLSSTETDALCSRGVVTFDIEIAQKLEIHLSEIAILDPAAGSGAFLQCAFELLHRIRLGLSQFLHHPIDQGLLARQILSRNLYGVDIIPTANQICELRLWLELMRYSDPSQVSPLPNLDMNIICGDTLTDFSQFATVLGLQVSNISSDKLSRLKRKYRLSHGKTKKKLAKEIERETRDAGKTLLNSLFETYQRECLSLENSSRELFTREPSPTLAQKKRIRILKEQIQKIGRILNANDFIPGFSYHLQFGEILEKGGFDIILGNPPWMSLYKLPSDTQTALKALYETAIPLKQTKRPHSADLSSLFVEKAIQCVKPQGIITMIVPNKLFQAPSYMNFQSYINSHAHILKYIDWSQKKENTFQASAYPASIIIQKQESIASHHKYKPFEQSQSFLSNYPITIIDKFIIKKGLCTSANDVFIGNTQIDSNALQNQMLFYSRIQTTPVPIESELICPILRGTDIKAYQIHPSKSIIYGYTKNNPCAPLNKLPPLAHAWFHSQTSILKARKGYQNKALHALSGSCHQLHTPKVVWRDISKQLEACFIKEGDILPLNTVYYIPVQTEADGYLLSAWLNSSIVRKHCQEIAEHARNNYRRYQSWVIETLPWPFDELSSTCAEEIQQIIKLSEYAHTNPNAHLEIQVQIDNLITKCLSLLSSYTPQSTPLSQTLLKDTNHAITLSSSKSNINDMYANPH